MDKIEKFFEYFFPSDYKKMALSEEDYEVGGGNTYLILYPTNELLEANKDYEVSKYAPNHVLIGTNGGGVGVFYNRNNNNLFSIPLIGLAEEDALKLAPSLTELVEGIEKESIEII